MSEPVSVRSGLVRSNRTLGRSQELVWAGQRLAPQAPVANTAMLYRISGPLDPDRFVAAFDEVARAADCLRMVVVEVGGSAQLHVLSEPPARTEVVSLPAPDVQAWADRRIAVPLPMDRVNYDSVLLRHDAHDWSWYLNVHHVVADAWGATLLYQATAARYHGRTLDLCSFAAYLRDLAASRENGDVRREQARDRWTAAMSHSTTVPSSFYREGPETSVNHRLAVPFDEARCERLERRVRTDLKALSRDLGVLAVLATATVAFLHRLSGQRHIRIGVPVHHRRTDTERRTAGLLMELFPLAVDVESHESLRSLHAKVTRALFDVLKWAEPDTSPRPDFDVVLNVITASSGPFGTLPCTALWLHSGHVDSSHRLRIQYFDFTGAGHPQLALDVNEAVADTDHRQRMPGHFLAVLDALIDDPDLALDGFALVDDTEATALCRRFNATGPGAQPRRPIFADIVATLRQRSGSNDIALEEGDTILTGPELADRIDTAARWLISRGVQAGDRVGVRLARSAEAVVATLAVLRAGAAFVPLDPTYPASRLEHITADAGLAVVIDGLPHGAELDRAPGAAPPAHVEFHVPSLDDEAYVLYTSGSTGLPKGVPITHRGLTEYMDFARSSYVGPDRPIVGLFSSLSFDLTITSLFLPLLCDGTLVVYPGENGAALAAVAQQGRVTFLKATPSHLELLLRMVPPSTAAPSALRCLVVGGEAFPRTLAQRLRSVYPEAAIYNEYGPTEAVVGCMVHRYDPDVDVGVDVPIGRPAPGVSLFVLDEVGNPVPMGVAGELYIARPGLSAGYLNRPDLTAERFVPVPAAVRAAAGPTANDATLYRSGDLVRFRDDHTLLFCGRLDDQLKVGGVRLEPAEVEAALTSHPGVARAAVALWTPSTASPAGLRRCTRCGLADDVAGVRIDTDGCCNLCHDYAAVAAQAERYFGTTAELIAARDRARQRRRGRFDVLHLLSGGKDSTYALYRLVELGFDVYAFTLDNGFISEEAKANIARVVADLGVEHVFATTDAMNEIFRDSLERFSNVCNGCYKTIYTLSVNHAHSLGIPMIVTGLSRGQFFETRLTPGQFALDRFDPEAIDDAVLAARKVYHRTNDAVSRLLDVSLFDSDLIFEEIEFVDFYRYEDVELQEVLRFLDERAPWIRPSDTGRSTNCLINAAGIAVHKLERGFHNYALPYSWDVRVGHKTRDAALQELDDPVDHDEVTRLLAEVGYEPRARQILTAWYSSAVRPAVDIDPDELRSHVAQRVPAHAVPSAYVRIEEMPLSVNGKLDMSALPAPSRAHRESSTGYLPPSGLVEENLCELWAALLGLDQVGALDDFFELGGTSLDALEMVVILSETYDLTIPAERAFLHRTVRELAAEVEALVTATIDALDEETVARHLDEAP